MVGAIYLPEARLKNRQIRRRSEMNYHCIDYMIKERQREELEACARRRLLKSAGHSQGGLVHMAKSGFLSTVRRLKVQLTFLFRRLQTNFSMLNNVAETQRDCQ
jgi:hypothetical protein